MKSKKRQIWFTERFTPGEEHRHQILEYLVRKNTGFQNIMLVRTKSLGKCLILDKEIQSAQLDEYIYHEALVHPAMISLPQVENVLILGGGEGATLREVLKYPSVRKAVMVDIDNEAVDFCKKFLREWHKNSFLNRRAEIIYTDAYKYIRASKEKFDTIISDLPSPLKGGPAWKLYTIEFYKELKKHLTTRGIFSLQAGSANLLQIKLFASLYSTLKKVFNVVRPYWEFVPSFDVPWAFITASDTIDPLKLKGEKVDSLLKKNKINSLRFYDSQSHKRIFSLPKHIRKILENSNKIITDCHPVYFYK